VFLDYTRLADENHIVIVLGDRQSETLKSKRFDIAARLHDSLIIDDGQGTYFSDADSSYQALKVFYKKASSDREIKNRYELKHAKLAIEAASVLEKRLAMIDGGQLPRLPEPAGSAADDLYLNTVKNLTQGLTTLLDSYANEEDIIKKRLYSIWMGSHLERE
jgi:ribosomal protein L14E/L6E/L27E